MSELDLSKAYAEKQPWKILIADDDEDVRLITQLVLKTLTLDDRSLAFFFAESSTDVISQMQSHPDIGVVLLDMIMESKDAGFVAVDQIRNHLKNHQARIIMRTGKSCDELDESEFLDYDINGFREKTLSPKQLCFTVIGALRSYRDIIRATDKKDINQPQTYCLAK